MSENQIDVEVGDIWKFREGASYYDEFYLVYQINKRYIFVQRLDTGDMIEDYSIKQFYDDRTAWTLVSRQKHE